MDSVMQRYDIPVYVKNGAFLKQGYSWASPESLYWRQTCGSGDLGCEWCCRVLPDFLSPMSPEHHYNVMEVSKDQE